MLNFTYALTSILGGHIFTKYSLSVIILMMVLPAPMSIFTLTFLSCQCSSPMGTDMKNSSGVPSSSASSITCGLMKTESAYHADMVGKVEGDCAMFIGVVSHCDHTWFSTYLVYSWLLLFTYHLIMSLFHAESTLQINYWAFLSLLMGSFLNFPHLSLLSWFWVLPLWDLCLLLLLGWTLVLHL